MFEENLGGWRRVGASFSRGFVPESQWPLLVTASGGSLLSNWNTRPMPTLLALNAQRGKRE